MLPDRNLFLLKKNCFLSCCRINKYGKIIKKKKQELKILILAEWRTFLRWRRFFEITKIFFLNQIFFQNFSFNFGQLDTTYICIEIIRVQHSEARYYMGAKSPPPGTRAIGLSLSLKFDNMIRI